MPRSFRWPGAALGAVVALAFLVGHVAKDSIRSDTDRITDLLQSRRLLTQLEGSIEAPAANPPGRSPGMQTDSEQLVRLLDRRIERARDALALDAATDRDASIVAVAAAVTLVLLAVLGWWGRQSRPIARVHHGDPRWRELEGAVESQARELFELSTYLQTLQEAEKADLARNLHDELGALLTAAKLDLAWVQKRLQNTGTALQARLTEIGKILESAMGVKRRVVEGLRPSLLDEFGLTSALMAHFRETCQQASLKLRTRISAEVDSAPPAVALAIFHAAQESLTNVVRHACAGSVELELEADPRGYHVRISDDGRGIAADARPGSHGLRGIRHRVRSLRGSMEVESRRGQGTSIRLWIPRDDRPTHDGVERLWLTDAGQAR